MSYLFLSEIRWEVSSNLENFPTYNIGRQSSAIYNPIIVSLLMFSSLGLNCFGVVPTNKIIIGMTSTCIFWTFLSPLPNLEAFLFFFTKVKSVTLHVLFFILLWSCRFIYMFRLHSRSNRILKSASLIAVHDSCSWHFPFTSNPLFSSSGEFSS